MFHRVKSEAEDTGTKLEEPASGARDDRVEDTQKEEPAQTKDEVKREDTVNETQPEKEEKPMSQAETADDKKQAQIDIPSSAYQRAGTAPASNAGGGYPGTAAAATTSPYPGYGAANAVTSGSSGDRRLTIGAGITMSGEIESCDYLLVEGTVEAALKGASVLEIAETGVFYGTVEIEDATIAGRFEGDITAQGRLVLREGATVTGTILYKELEIEAGAIIDGKLTPLSGVQASEKPAPSSTKKEKDAKPAGKAPKAQSEKTPEPANNEGGLFSKATAAAE